MSNLPCKSKGKTEERPLNLARRPQVIIQKEGFGRKYWAKEGRGRK